MSDTKVRAFLLDGLKVTKVDLVDAGADPRAHVALFKRRDDERWGDEEYIAKRQFTTEQRIELAKKGWAIPVRGDDGEIVDGRYPIETEEDLSNAVQAFGRGAPGDKDKIRSHITAQAKRLKRTDLLPKDWPGSTKKGLGGRLLESLAKRLGLKAEDLEKHYDEAEAETYAEARRDNDEARAFDRVESELWERVWALRDAMCSTLRDTSAENREGLIRASLIQFTADVERALPSWLAGQPVDVEKVGRKISAARLAHLKEAHIYLGKVIAEAEDGPGPAEEDTSKAKEVPMGDQPKFDVSTLPEEAQQFINGLTKRAETAESRVTELEDQVSKGSGDQPAGGDEDPVAKALADPNVPDSVKKALESEKGRREEAEKQAAEALTKARQEEDVRKTREFVDVAKAMPHLPGTKPEDLGPVLKTLAEKAPEEYKKIEELLQRVDKAIETGDLFKTAGVDGPGSSDAWQQIEAKAAELMAADSSLTKSMAIDKALEQNPELRKAYDEDRAAGARR